LFLVQVAKLWFQGSVSPLAVLVPPTLVLAEGLGTGLRFGVDECRGSVMA
jgi:hypothetical protein